MRLFHCLSRSLTRTLLLSLVGLLIAVIGGLKYRAAMMEPNFTQRATLTASDGASSDEFGGESGIAISGETVVIGARGNNGGKGAAYVFVRSGSGWTQQAKLTATDGVAGDEFGLVVAIQGDTIMVSAPYTNSFRGSVYVFTRSGSSWTQQAKLNASDRTPGDRFGWSVAFEGTTAVIGAIFANIAGKREQGAAYLFEQSATGWTEQRKLTASDGAAEDWFGTSVGISQDTVVVGAGRDDVGSNTNQGSAYVFVRSGTEWLEQSKLTANAGTSNSVLGFDLAIYGNTIIVGAFGADGDKGAAYIFTRSGVAWTQQQKLSASDGIVPDHFGARVALNGDRILVTADLARVDNKLAQGAAYLFKWSGTNWSQQQKLIANDGAAGDQFGLDGAFSGDYAVIGARFRDIAGKSNQGAAYYFAPENTAPQITAAAPISREQGASGTVSPIATVSDGETPVGQLTVTAAPLAGIALTEIKNSNGAITAKVAADCTAKLGDNQIVLTVSDGRLTATANLTVNVTANQLPSAGLYPETFIAKVGETTVINPTIKPTDNGALKSITATAQGLTGTFSANLTTGDITVTNPGPMGEYLVNVVVEDNCGAKATTQFKLHVAFAPDLQVAGDRIKSGGNRLRQ